MKNIFATVLISAATLGFATTAVAATSSAKAEYKAAKEGAKADYKTASQKCQSLTGNPKDVCMEEAEAARAHTKADARVQYKSTPDARASARIKIANAEYDVAKAKCGSQTGNARDVCIKEAKAVNVAAQADAKADKKVVTARVDAMDDKRAANYKVGIEKCDAFAGVKKDNCVASVKAQYGK